MNRFTRRTRSVLSSFLKILSCCFAANTSPDDEKDFSATPFVQTSHNSDVSIDFLTECNAIEIRKTSLELEKAIRDIEQTQLQQQFQMVAVNLALVLHPNCDNRSVYSDTAESADEEIDISGLAPPRRKTRNWEVKNARMYREARESDGEKRKGMFRKMAARFRRT